MNILLVGAGAVGKIYGRYLSLGGAQVSFLVKEKHTADARGGYPIYVLNDRTKKDKAQLFTQFTVLTQLEEVKRQKWDYVILCMASPAIRGSWLEDLIQAMGDATLVSLQPGLHDRNYLLTKISTDRLVDGTIPIISYDTSLLNEDRTPPGTAYWIPPGGHAAFSGTPSRRDPLLRVFTKGGFKVKAVPDVKKVNVIAAPVLTVFVAALEASSWSFEKLNQSPLLGQACRAMIEAVAANAKSAGVENPASWFLRPLLFKSLMKLSQAVVPFCLEPYLKVHFTKVSQQMHQSLRDYHDYAKNNQLPSQELEQMLRALGLGSASPN